MMPPYMPMYGYSLPVMPIGGAGPASYNTPNPASYNYPKMANLRGSQYTTYPQFKETKKVKDTGQSENLAKELEKQIKELQTLTKEAKELAKKKLNEGKVDNIKNTSTFIEITNQKVQKKSNLDEIKLTPKDKEHFDNTIKKVIQKIDNTNN
jgi:hypothetical protein